VKHPDDTAMPDMTEPETAFQAYDPDENTHDRAYDYKLRLNKPIYLARHNPHMLARTVMDAGRQVRPDSCTAASCCAQGSEFALHLKRHVVMMLLGIVYGA
jgi:hypothetical protein